MRFFFILSMAAWLASCYNNNRSARTILIPNRIADQTFSVDPAKHIVLRTSHGSTFTIRKGTFATTQPVTITIKEIFTPAEMLLAGMETASNGNLLRSAGMFSFIASADGQKLKFEKPVEVTIPTGMKDPGMELFKGDSADDGRINWVEPEKMDTLPGAIDLENGRQLFNANCRTCHGINKNGTGPALAGFQNRGPWKNPNNLVNFIHNPARFIGKDRYSYDLSRKYAGHIMTAFPALDVQSINDIAAYISSDPEEEQPTPAVDSNKAVAFDTAGNMPDPCSDTMYVVLQDSRRDFDTTTIPQIIEKRFFLTTVSAVLPAYDLQKYVFKIDDNGWYNIDAFQAYTSNQWIVPSLSVKIKNQETDHLEVMLLMPSIRLMQALELNDEVYKIPYDDRKLPKGERAVVIAFEKVGTGLRYAVQQITLDSINDVELELMPISEEGLRKMIEEQKIGEVDLQLLQTKPVITTGPCYVPVLSTAGSSGK